MTAMTDEEQRLVTNLRKFTELDIEPWLVRVGRDAADEIERLANELAEVKNELRLWREQG